MDTKTFKKIARLLKAVYAELEKKALEEGVSIISPEYEELANEARERVLTRYGYTIDEYRAIKEKLEADRQEEKKSKDFELKEVFSRISQLKGDAGEAGLSPTDEHLLSIIRPLIPTITQPEDGHTPTKEELLDIIRPLIPEVKNGETPSDERLLSLIRPLIPPPKDIPTKRIVEEVVASIKIPEPVDVEKIKEEMATEFGKMFEYNINTLGMPDFRKLAMGLRADIDRIDNETASGGGVIPEAPTSGTVDGSNTIFVFATAPNILYVDSVPKQKVQSDGTVNWTGTTTVTLSVAPNFDIFSI